MPKSAIVVDDNAASRIRTEGVLAALRLHVVATTPHNLNAPRLASTHAPDVVFVAVEEPHMRALQTIELIAARTPDAQIIAYSTDPSTSVFQQAVRAGAVVLLDAPLKADQAAKALARLVGTPDPTASSGNGRIIAVVGQKGGIGKTTISTNIAAALAAESHASVLIVDFDTRFGDVGLTLDIAAQSTVAEVASDLGRLERDDFKATLVRHESGAFVLPAPAHVGEWLSVSPEKLASLVEYAAEMFDYVVIDTPGAFNDAVAAALELADHAFIVTSMEVTSVKNTAMLLEVLATAGYPAERTLVVVNHTIAEPGVTVVDIAPTLGRDSVWEVPYDANVRRSSQAGHPVVLLDPKSLGGKSLRALANRIATQPDGIDRRSSVREPAHRGDAIIGSRLREAMRRLAS